jgi:hypothetical protein
MRIGHHTDALQDVWLLIESCLPQHHLRRHHSAGWIIHEMVLALNIVSFFLDMSVPVELYHSS